MRLMNKKRSVAAATVLWRYFDVYLEDSPTFDALLNSGPDGILDNVKHLVITNITSTVNLDLQQRKYSNLLKLFSVLPLDGLSSLKSHWFKLVPDLICVLLSSQTRLRDLDFIVDDSSSDYLPIPCIRGNLLELQVLGVDVMNSTPHTYEILGTWLNHMPNLRETVVKGRRDVRMANPNFFQGWALPASLELLKLHTLDIQRVSLPNNPRRITAHLYLPSLRHLELTHCANTVPFLNSLAQVYEQTGGAPFELYHYLANKSSKDAQVASERLIDLCTGLEVVLVAEMTQSLLNLRCLKASGRTLSKLVLSSNSMTCIPIYYSIADIEDQVVRCPNLRVLSVCLGSLTSIIDYLDWTEPFRLFGGTNSVQITKPTLIAGLENLQEMATILIGCFVFLPFPT